MLTTKRARSPLLKGPNSLFTELPRSRALGNRASGVGRRMEIRILFGPGPNAQDPNGPGESLVPHILRRGTLASRWCPASSTRVKRNGGGVSRLDVLAFMAYMALICGLLMLISARYGKSGWAWFWALAFVATSLLTDLLFWRGPDL